MPENAWVEAMERAEGPSSVPTNMHIELLIDVGRDEGYRAVVSDWLTSAITAVFPEVSGTAYPHSSLGAASLQFGGRSRSRKFTAANLNWALNEAVAGCSIWWAVQRSGVRDHAMARVQRDDVDKSFAQLILDVPEELFVDRSVQQRVVEAVRELADITDPVFGAAGYGGDATRTELEYALRSFGVFDEYPAARRYLRGYDWVTVVPKEIAADLGGVGALTDSGAFHRVAGLTSGVVVLVATEEFSEYRDVAARRVFETVARVLKPGLPRPGPQLGVPHPRTPLVLQDAADYGAGLRT